MKLTKGQMVTVSFMLFSLFFGAGNLIFPPFLGQNAARNTLPAFLGFLITAVLLPVLGVVVVAQSEGLDKLGTRVNSKFALVFTVLLYLSIGPGLGIPRVPIEIVNGVLRDQAGNDKDAIYNIGAEWCAQQCKDLIAHGVPAVHFYTMGKSANIVKILKECF